MGPGGMGPGMPSGMGDPMSAMNGMGMGGPMSGLAHLANDPIIVHIRDYGWVYVAAFVVAQFAGAAYLVSLFVKQYRYTQTLKRGVPAQEPC